MITAKEVNAFLLEKESGYEREKQEYEREYGYVDKKGIKRYYSTATIKNIEKQILEQVEYGNTCAEFFGRLKPDVVKILKDSGYRVFVETWVKTNLIRCIREWKRVSDTYITTCVVWGTLPTFPKDSEIEEL